MNGRNRPYQPVLVEVEQTDYSMATSLSGLRSRRSAGAVSSASRELMASTLSQTVDVIQTMGHMSMRSDLDPCNEMDPELDSRWTVPVIWCTLRRSYVSGIQDHQSRHADAHASVYSGVASREHLARFVVEIVDQLDLSEITSRYGGGGKHAYHPALLVALLFYCYATGVFSSRKLEQATYNWVAFRYISADRHPDHDTIANFRKRFLAELEGLFKQILIAGRESPHVRERLPEVVRKSVDSPGAPAFPLLAGENRRAYVSVEHHHRAWLAASTTRTRSVRIRSLTSPSRAG